MTHHDRRYTKPSKLVEQSQVDDAYNSTTSAMNSIGGALGGVAMNNINQFPMSGKLLIIGAALISLFWGDISFALIGYICLFIIACIFFRGAVIVVLSTSVLLWIGQEYATEPSLRLVAMIAAFLVNIYFSFRFLIGKADDSGVLIRPSNLQSRVNAAIILSGAFLVFCWSMGVGAFGVVTIKLTHLFGFALTASLAWYLARTQAGKSIMTRLAALVFGFFSAFWIMIFFDRIYAYF